MLLRALYRRPIATLMGWAAVVLLGIISWQKLPIELLPPLEYPQITVVARYPNASPEEIENLLIKPIEGAISGVQRLMRLEAHCREDIGFVHASFDWGSPMDLASLAIREKMDLIRDKLPQEADPPIVMKYSPFDSPTMVLAVTGAMTPEDLREYVVHTLKSRLEKTEGVAEVQVRGGQEREIRVEVKANKLLASGQSLLDISDALHAANINFPAGSVESKTSEFLLRTMGEFKRPGEIAELPLPQKSNDDGGESGVLEKAPITKPRVTIEQARAARAPAKTISEFSGMAMKDLARVVMGTKERRSFSRYDGAENISVTIRKQSGVRTTQVADALHETLLEVRDQAPEQVQIRTVFDQSEFIRASFRSVLEAVILGCLLTLGVLFYFLRNMRYSLIVFASIPCCLLGTSLAMHFTGVSLNMISLGGLALAVGMLVDNSIVVIENVHRHRRAGQANVEAAVAGTQEVWGAIFASTLAHVVVFLPLIYLTGIAGQVFRDLAFTVSFGLVFSLASAVTLTPLGMLTLGGGGKDTREILFSRRDLEPFYQKLFGQKKRVLWGAAAAFLAGTLLLLALPRELLPRVQPRKWTLQASLPVGMAVEETNRLLSQLEKTLQEHPAIAHVSLLIGAQGQDDAASAIAALRASEGEFLIELKEGSISTPERVMAQLQERLRHDPIPGLLLRYDLQRGILPVAAGSGGKRSEIAVVGNDLDALGRTVDAMRGRLEGSNGISGVHSSLVLGSPEARLSIARELASAYNVSARDIAATMKAAVEGVVPTTFKGGAYPVDIRVRLAPEDAEDFRSLGEIRIPTQDGNAVPLKKVAKLLRSAGPTEILRVDKQRRASISFEARSGRAAATALKAMQEIAGEHGMQILREGEQKILGPALRDLFWTLLLSLILLYMVLAAQFESLKQPFLILFTVPLSILGVGLALMFTGQSVNAISMLGVVVMGGIVVNNGILFVSVANQRMQEKADRAAAAIDAAHLRLRPILMTSATTVLAMLPLAIGLGEGAEINSPLAVVIIGGMLSSTVLVLGVLPTMWNWETRRSGVPESPDSTS